MGVGPDHPVVGGGVRAQLLRDPRLILSARMGKKVVLAIVALAVAAGTLGLVRMLRYGLSARDKPTRLEV
jgi:hypothetical protein